MDKNLEDVVEIDEDDFLEAILQSMKQYLSYYYQLEDVLNQYNFDKERYLLKYYYNKQTGEYFYTKQKKPKLGFQVEGDKK